jgi:hypothetical protein
MIRKIFGIYGLMLLVALATAVVAKADEVDSFTYTVGGDTFVWQLLASPSNVDPYAPDGFMLSDVAVSQNGGAPVLTELTFFSDVDEGGFYFPFGNFFPNTFGDQLYTGPEATPTFKIDTFQLSDFGTASDGKTGVPGTLVISKVSVPEPPAYLLLMVGSLGWLLVTRRKS